MVKLAFVLLAHKDPEGVIAQARRLTATGDYVSIHYDGRASFAEYHRIRHALADHPSVTFAPRRIRCGWGEWSLVAATLGALRAAAEHFPLATHFYLISGDCLPIKSAEHARDFLGRDDLDHIETVDFHRSGWIRTGIRDERLIYRHPFNERRHPKLFYASIAVQRRLGLARRLPRGIGMRIGSQWWCLRRETVEALFDLCRRRPEILRFFRMTWIPDETFFQTLVAHLVPAAQIRNRPPTFLMFTDYGFPVTFCNDHEALLLAQDCLFARKISPEAHRLRAALGDLWAKTGQAFPISDEGRAVYGFLTGRGRVGARFAPRIWDTGAQLQPDWQVLIVLCKKWHVAKRLLDAVRAQDNRLSILGYLFSEPGDMPDLGGIESSLVKRNRHRRSLLRLLFETFDTRRLAICVDPADLDLVRDLVSSRAEVCLLTIGCAFSEDYLAGHARRIGLATATTPVAVMAALLPALRSDLAQEAERLHAAGFAKLWQMHESFAIERNAAALEGFLGLDSAAAEAIARTDHLFTD